MTMKMALALDVAIIGEPDSGKATFLVLLYAAQIRYSEFSANKNNEFRFYINPYDIEKISSEYNRMQMGNWPSDKLLHLHDTVSGPISFVYGRTKESMADRFFSIFNKEQELETFSVNFSIYDLSDPDLAECINNEKMTYINLKPQVESLLSSSIILMSFDCSKLHNKSLAEPEKVEPDIDYQMVTALGNISRYKQRRIYPILVFTKSDLINKHYLANLSLPSRIPNVKNQKARKMFAERLMSNRFPNTLAFLKNSRKIYFEPGNSIFSCISTVRKKGGKLTPALKLTPDAGYVLDCSYAEFIYFIQCLENISKKMSN